MAVVWNSATHKFQSALATRQTEPPGTPTLTALAGIGTAPPAPTLQTGSQDIQGILNFGTGTAPAAGAAVQLTFSALLLSQFPAFNPNLVVLWIPQNALSAALQPYQGSSGYNLTTLNLGVAPAASQAAGTYSFAYIVFQFFNF